MNCETVLSLVDDQLSYITQPELIEWVRTGLITPRCEQRPWDYGVQGQTFPCWIVWEHAESSMCIAYCEHGFGPTYPWGLLYCSGQYLNMGADSEWFYSLEDALRNTPGWYGENPPNYEVA
jgi:hypothetical protein